MDNYSLGPPLPPELCFLRQNPHQSFDINKLITLLIVAHRFDCYPHFLSCEQTQEEESYRCTSLHSFLELRVRALLDNSCPNLKNKERAPASILVLAILDILSNLSEPDIKLLAEDSFHGLARGLSREDPFVTNCRSKIQSLNR